MDGVIFDDEAGKAKTASSITTWVYKSPATGSLLGKQTGEKMTAEDALKRVDEARKSFETEVAKFHARFRKIELVNQTRINNLVETLEERIKTAKEEAKNEAVIELSKEVAIVREKSKEDLDGLRNRFREELEDVKEKSIATLAVFVGLFTFVSVDFQLFKKFPDWYAAAGIVFISAAIMIGFVLLTHYLFSGSAAGSGAINDPNVLHQQSNERFKLGMVSFIIFASLSIGLGLLYLSTRQASDDIEAGNSNNTFNPSTSIQFTTLNQNASSTQSISTSTSR